MVSTGKCKLIKSPKQRRSLQQRRSRKRHKESESTKESVARIESELASESESPGSSESLSDSKLRRTVESLGDSKSLRSSSESLQRTSSKPRKGSVIIPGMDPLQRVKSGYLPDLPYGRKGCKRCQQLAKLEIDWQPSQDDRPLYSPHDFIEDEHFKLRPMPDDKKYLYKDEDFGGDGELKLRLIHHRRKKYLSGIFYADCQPSHPCFGGVFHRDHYYEHSDFDLKIMKSIKFVLKTYKEKEGKELVLLRVLNVTAQVGSCIGFYITFECFNESPKGNDSYVDVYQTAVTCSSWRIGDHTVSIFRKMERSGEGIDLLPPHPYDKMVTRVKTELLRKT